MSVEHSPEHGIAYHFVSYDAHGRERPSKRDLASNDLLETAAHDRPSDVFLFSHGWHADPKGALAHYGRWVDAMAARTGDRERLRARTGGFHPLLVGVHWPSKAWADEELTGMSYAVPGDSATDPPSTAALPDDDPVEPLVDRYADRLEGGHGARDAVRRIVESALHDTAPPTLPKNVREAYEHLDAGLGLEHAGAGTPPGDDRDPFDPEETYQAALLLEMADPVSFSGFSLGGVLAPLRVLSFWAMKRRARTFGETGAAELLGLLQSALPASRFHVIGHSFGCIVASAAVAAAAGPPGVRRGVDTLVLLQGAMSLWSFCSDIPARTGSPGYFHGLIRDGLIRGPVLVTTSTHDRAVRVFYPLGAGLRGDFAFDDASLPMYGGIGTFGVRGPGIEIRDEELGRVDETYEFRPHIVYNLNADTVITKLTGISGAHSDICHPEVARAVWRAAEGRPKKLSGEQAEPQ
jgi:hypothetical protein